MKSINAYTDQALRWIQPNKCKGAYELRGGDEVFARLRFTGSFHSQLYVETADASWIIKQKGWSQTLLVLEGDSQLELASIKRGMGGKSTYRSLDGREYTWRCTSFWRNVWAWFNNEDTLLLQLVRGSRVELEPASYGIRDVVLLAALGWYMHKQQEEGAAVAAIVPVI